VAKAVSRLGKGLSALITPGSEQDATAFAGSRVAGGVEPQVLPLGSIRPSKLQPRQHFEERSLRELADSIRSKGLLQPLIVRPSDGGAYELVAGERRWRAAQAAGLQTVPAIVKSVSDAEALELSLVENLQRADLNAVERAEAYRRYLEAFGGTVEELAERLGESRANVSNYLRLLNLSDEVLRMLTAGELSMGHVRAIAGVEDRARQIAIARLAARRRLAVRQVEAIVKSSAAVSDERGGRGSRPVHITDAEQALTRALGLPVRIQPGRAKNSGRIVIGFSNLEEFERVAVRLGWNQERG